MPNIIEIFEAIGPVGPAGPAGTNDFAELENVPLTFPPSSHVHSIGNVTNLSSTLAKVVVQELELVSDEANGGIATTIGIGDLPARAILFTDGGGTFTINLPTPSKRQSGLTFSIKREDETQDSGDVFVSVIHNGVNLLTGRELDENEGSIDFSWNGHAWLYNNKFHLYSVPNRDIILPSTSGILTFGVSENDFEVTDATKGIILKSPNNTRFRISVNNSGVLTTTAL